MKIVIADNSSLWRDRIKSISTMRLPKMLFILLMCILSGLFVPSNAQVKITDGALLTMDPNSLLELESTNKGLLIPRVAINDLNLPAPLIGTVPPGMLVYSSGGTVANGFYYWNGANWDRVLSTGANILKTFTRNANATLSKSDNIIFARNDIILTLPAVTSADTGLIISIKNVGIHTDLVKVTGSGGATIDDLDTVEILPREGETYIARGSNWAIRDREMGSEDIIDVGPESPFKTIGDALEFLDQHMNRPKVIRIGGIEQSIPYTHIIDLPYPVTIQGSSFGSGGFVAGPGLTGKPMFRCKSECYFKMLTFDATTLTNYGTLPGEDAIRLVGSGTYHEIKDCTFDRFYNTIIDSSDAELWLFECDISNSQGSGLLLNSALAGAKVRVSETDFIGCVRGVNLAKGSNTEISLISGNYHLNNVTDIAILYSPPAFSFSEMVISGNSWNYIGTGIAGFDFTRADGRDANAFIENNAGATDQNPHCQINVVNNALTTTCTTAGTWYKANWITTSSYTTNFLLNNNKITYQSQKTRDIYIIVSGNVSANSNNKTATIGIVKNGVTATRYGESALRMSTVDQPFQFSTVIYLNDVNQNAYFELFCSTINSGDILNFRDINIFVDSK